MAEDSQTPEDVQAPEDAQISDDVQTLLDLDIDKYELSDYDSVHIRLPEEAYATDEDVDSQLFGYLASMKSKKYTSVDQLDDAWVKDNFPDVGTIERLRDNIRAELTRDIKYDYADQLYQECSDALVERLQGDIPQEIIDHNVAATRKGNEEQLALMHLTMQQYLREQHLSPDEYEKKLVEDVIYTLKLNCVLDKMGVALNIQIGNNEITEYLSTPDPEGFLAEIREKGQVDAAKKAAARVKIMRQVMETAHITEIDEAGNEIDQEKKQAEKAKKAAEELDLGSMPAPTIEGAEIDVMQELAEARRLAPEDFEGMEMPTEEDVRKMADEAAGADGAGEAGEAAGADGAGEAGEAAGADEATGADGPGEAGEAAGAYGTAGEA